MNPNFCSLIIPARWFAGGRENLLGKFRDRVLHCHQIQSMFVFPDSRDLFPSVEIKGGVCYYLWNQSHQGQCRYCLKSQDTCDGPTQRNLDDFDILIRYSILNDIVKKVMESVVPNGKCVDTLISNDTPFGIGSNPEDSKKYAIKVFGNSTDRHNVTLYYLKSGKRSVGYVAANSIKKNTDDVKAIKVFIPEGYGAGEGFPHQILGVPEVAKGNSVCSQTYLYAKFGTQKEAKNFVSYLKTMFFRVLVLAAKVTQHAQSGVYRFVPIQDFTEPWDDAKLYKKYGITAEEQKFIESMIKPMA